MPKTLLADLADGMTVQTQAYLRQKRLIPYKNKPGSFLVLSLADRSGEMEGKIFDNAEEIARTLPDGEIISISGRASSYQGVLGLVLDKAEVWTGAVDYADFMPAYAGDVQALETRLDELISSITEPDLARLVQSIFNDPEIRTKYCTAPAGKAMHGAYLHGLLEHVIHQAEIAETVCKCYPKISRDLLITGVLLHDIGKILELSWAMSIEYTTLGQLEGHIVLGDRLVFDRGRELGISEELARRVSHMLLSHHGALEFGAPVVPKTLEAIVLHYLDNLEAKASHCISMMDKADPSAPWTEFDRTEARVWYCGEPVNAPN